MKFMSFRAVSILLAFSNPVLSDDLARQTADAIRTEASLPNHSPKGHPLPLVGSWNTASPWGYGPDYQLNLIEQGHHLLPWFQLSSPKDQIDTLEVIRYYHNALKRCAELGLPISFISSQWESLLSAPPYLGLPPAQNPNVIKSDGTIDAKVSPFGPVEPWREVGNQWASSKVMRQIQDWYPNPPLILFISNNEHAKLTWSDANLDQRFAIKQSRVVTDDDKRKAVGDGWIERYRALQSGMRDGLASSTWRNNSLFIGYNAFGGPTFGSWEGWVQYSLHIPGRFNPSPLTWDGGSPSFYVTDENNPSSTDYTVQSPQIEAMNWIFMLEEAYQLNSNFWFEMSIWDGYQPKPSLDKRAFYIRKGQTYNPDRYAGMAKFGLWLMRPRVMREYRNYDQTRADTESYFMELVAAVDALYTNPVLESFWRHGELLPNPKHLHPYQTNIPPEYADKVRWFLLESDINPPHPWKFDTEIPVFGIALTKGSPPKREWLVYVYSPLMRHKNIQLTVPGYGSLTVETQPKGDYYWLKENNRTVNKIKVNQDTQELQ